ncbi:growth hormone secretagogue receptor type 1-like [Argopecten irradians]|uniref:growth hormone secretagogue receptor type 1-like n=1 Tax=Argopecten irradians TaxID=31199 RepID=UPI003710FD2F
MENPSTDTSMLSTTGWTVSTSMFAMTSSDNEMRSTQFNGSSSSGSGMWTTTPETRMPIRIMTTTPFPPGLLEKLNDEKALLYLPVIIFVGFLMIVGIIGNMLVIYVYSFKYKSRSSNHFIVSMASFDLLSSLICMPIDIYDVRFHYTFYSVVACKLFRYSQNVTTFGSVIILIEIAFDRYVKICRPLRIVSALKIKIMCAIAGILATILSVPALILFGITRAPTHVTGLFGHDCSVSEEYKDSMFRDIFYKYFIPLLFGVSFMLLAGFYIRIWYEIRRRKDIIIGEKPGSTSQPSNEHPVGGQYIVKRPRYLSSASDDESSVFTNNKRSFKRSLSTSSRKSRLGSISEALSQVKVSRTTKIFIAVTAAFVLSYLPTMVVQVLVSRQKGSTDTLSEEKQLILKLFARSYYINNVINPVIYSFLNVNFRTHCSKLITSTIASCKGSFHRRTSSFRGSFRKVNGSRSDSKSNPTHDFEMNQLK